MLNAVESVYEASMNEQSSIASPSSLPSLAAGPRVLGTSSKKKAKSNILNAFKSELREYRSLQEELSPWTNAFVERHGRKPTMLDVQRTGIEWLVMRYKQYIILRDRLFSESPLLRSKLSNAIPEDDGYMSDGGSSNNTGIRQVAGGTMSLPGSIGPMNANGPSVAAKSVLAARVATAMQYKMSKQQQQQQQHKQQQGQRQIFEGDHQGMSSAAKINGEFLLSASKTSKKHAISSTQDGDSDSDEEMHDTSETLSTFPSQTKAPPRVRAAMQAAMEYRKKKAQATRAAAHAAAVAAKASPSVTSSLVLHVESSMTGNPVENSMETAAAEAESLARKASQEVKEAEMAVQRVLAMNQSPEAAAAAAV